ncbi:unnamed protein product [Adineta steineri]|uniref:Kinesin light chain n=2 Tax=Adineta steineri TaxID=433720 RepID=A0A813UUM4_9BILA|nr:unnamed protein product [Adineta steineri]
MTSVFAGLSFTKHTMGLVKHALGQREEAISLLKETLEIRRQSYGDDHPDVAQVYYSLAVIYADTDDKQIAFQYAQTALNIYQAKLPKHHPSLKRASELVERISSYQRESILPQSEYHNVQE